VTHWSSKCWTKKIKQRLIADFACCGYYVTATREERVFFCAEDEEDVLYFFFCHSACTVNLGRCIECTGIVLLCCCLYHLTRYKPAQGCTHSSVHPVGGNVPADRAPRTILGCKVKFVAKREIPISPRYLSTQIFFCTVGRYCAGLNDIQCPALRWYKNLSDFRTFTSALVQYSEKEIQVPVYIYRYTEILAG
jgi:hypothetical protein